MITQEVELSYDQFLCFLMLYAAEVDFEINNLEEDAINSRFDAEVVSSTRQFYDGLTDYKILQVIKSHTEHFCNEESCRMNLLETIHSSFMADGEYNPLEKEIYLFISKYVLS